MSEYCTLNTKSPVSDVMTINATGGEDEENRDRHLLPAMQ